MRERRMRRRVGEEEGVLGRSVEGSIRTGERRAVWCWCSWSLSAGTVLVGDEGVDFDFLEVSIPGADGGGSRGIVLSVLVLVTRRKSGPVGLCVVGDNLVGEGGGSEALDAMYGWIDRGIVTDTLRDGGMTGRRADFDPRIAGPGAKISP
jgi:hypothetical protein